MYAAQFIGQAFVTAYNLDPARTGRRSSAVADAVHREEGDLRRRPVRLLDAQHFVRPEIDWTDEATWPKIMNWSQPAAPRASAASSPASPPSCSMTDEATPAPDEPPAERPTERSQRRTPHAGRRLAGAVVDRNGARACGFDEAAAQAETYGKRSSLVYAVSC